MKKFLLSSFLLLTTAANYSSDRPVKTMLRTIGWGLPVAGLGYALSEGVNRSLANYSLDFPPVVTHTPESLFLLSVCGAAGAWIVSEKVLCDTATPFDGILPDMKQRYRVGKTLEIGIKSATAFAILTLAGRQSPLDAACYTLFGLGVLTTCLENDEKETEKKKPA